MERCRLFFLYGWEVNDMLPCGSVSSVIGTQITDLSLLSPDFPFIETLFMVILILGLASRIIRTQHTGLRISKSRSTHNRDIIMRFPSYSFLFRVSALLCLHIAVSTLFRRYRSSFKILFNLPHSEGVLIQ